MSLVAAGALRVTVPCVSVYMAVTSGALFLAIVPLGHPEWGALGDINVSVPHITVTLGLCRAEVV